MEEKIKAWLSVMTPEAGMNLSLGNMCDDANTIGYLNAGNSYVVFSTDFHKNKYYLAKSESETEACNMLCCIVSKKIKDKISFAQSPQKLTKYFNEKSELVDEIFAVTCSIPNLSVRLREFSKECDFGYFYNKDLKEFSIYKNENNKSNILYATKDELAAMTYLFNELFDIFCKKII